MTLQEAKTRIAELEEDLKDERNDAIQDEAYIKMLRATLSMAINWLDRFDSTCPQHIVDEIKVRLGTFCHICGSSVDNGRAGVYCPECD